MTDGDSTAVDGDARRSDPRASTDGTTGQDRASGDSRAPSTGGDRESSSGADRDPLEPDGIDADASDPDAPGRPEASTAPADERPEELRARLDVLTAENERLRREYLRARRSQHRRAALALALVGLVALVGAWGFPAQREVLLALAGTGLFGAALTFYLTPEQFVAASVAERVHDAHAANQRALATDLGLQDERVYVPTPESTGPAKLFVPQRTDHELPDDPEHLFVVAEEPTGRGVALVPTGGPLYEEFEATVTGEPATEPAALAAQLADAAVETFELADAAATEPDLDGGRVVLTVSDPTFGDLDALDHPVVSVVGTGLAAGLGVPVTTAVEETGETGRIVYDWPTAELGRPVDGE